MNPLTPGPYPAALPLEPGADLGGGVPHGLRQLGDPLGRNL